MTPQVKTGYIPYTYLTVDTNGEKWVDGGVIDESQLTIYVNGFYIATVMCSPLDETALALGFLYNEGIIHHIDEVQSVELQSKRQHIFVEVSRKNIQFRRRLTLTSGCGGGVTFQDLNDERAPVQTDFVTQPDIVLSRMRDLRAEAHLYQQVRGVHTAILADNDRVRYVAEDVGRHNTVDKIAGKALQDDYNTSHAMLLTSGRISSEMIGKANRMNIAIVASRTAPTSQSVKLAAKWGISLIGYVRPTSMRIYTHPHRLGYPLIV